MLHQAESAAIDLQIARGDVDCLRHTFDAKYACFVNFIEFVVNLVGRDINTKSIYCIWKKKIYYWYVRNIN